MYQLSIQEFIDYLYIAHELSNIYYGILIFPLCLPKWVQGVELPLQYNNEINYEVERTKMC